ncbi:hypothetical protein B0H63DRAFT_111744 [Podospora didyma]|uniref:Uncharacterized protein n=1 Tax=Podospora didyma TaxID=330526 RepID=A0AAE0NZ54_9PEZI|nr:hypothetical protein B0H63DRAFT_111744 [Podospora didyma]
MARRQLLPALAWAQTAVAVLQGHIDANVFANVEARAATTTAPPLGSDGIFACATANAVLSSCYNAGWLDDEAPVASSRSCLCCGSGHGFAADYSTCASYIYDEMPTLTNPFSTASYLYSLCSRVGTSYCGTASGTKTTQGPIPTVIPAGCTSLYSIITSCVRETPGLITAGAARQASCLCYDADGAYNTQFDRYVRTCASWARTAYIDEYRTLSRSLSFCEDHSSRTSTTRRSSTPTRRSTTSATSTHLDVSDWNSLTAGTPSPAASITSAPLATTTTPPLSGTGAGAGAGTNTSSSRATAVTTTVTSSGLAPPGAAPAGLFIWIANLATLLLSFFFMI